MAILITGGAGYIGSHTMVELLNAGRELVVVDNFVNSKPESLKRVKEITGKDFKFYEVDLLDYDALDKVFCVLDKIFGLENQGAANKGEIVTPILLFMGFE